MFRGANRATRARAFEAPAPPSGPSTREVAAASLSLELLPTRTACDGRAAWHVADGLAAALLVSPPADRGRDDEPAPRRPAHPDELVAWGLGQEEAFHLASANVRGADLPNVAAHAPTGAAELLLVTGADVTTSAHALWLDDLVEGVPPVGALVAVPHQRAVLAHRLDRFDHAVEAVNLLVIMADAAWREGPDPVSPDLYWWHDGTFTALHAGLVDDDVHVDPPAEFLDALEGLPRA